MALGLYNGSKCRAPCLTRLQTFLGGQVRETTQPISSLPGTLAGWLARTRQHQTHKQPSRGMQERTQRGGDCISVRSMCTHTRASSGWQCHNNATHLGRRLMSCNAYQHWWNALVLAVKGFYFGGPTPLWQTTWQLWAIYLSSYGKVVCRYGLIF